MPTTAATLRTLSVPGSTLHFRTEGRGPVLLISQSGEGDADRTVDLVPHLADTFTVVTYDRRGLRAARSTTPPAPSPWPTTRTTSRACSPRSPMGRH
ncbi:alpha/beta fold hydrolase [Streptomyces sp. NBC_00162]|uniref:alpha/beta fold hydrolase n=1 Tax=Streptomyces sp. NBC_00162 TaxID=2903629 RepID=UPI00214C2BB1|nr:hypothetical protein [Streptomyces sp. NBC_00162]UUU37926.1 hypothetical protein JIW86_03015 [Streptomyces sp. NBC_00162]